MLIVALSLASCGGFGSGPPSRSNFPGDLPRIPWHGGPSYYSSYGVAANAGWTRDTFFPVGAWYMRAASQSDLQLYKSLGFNLDVAVESNASIPLLRANGMFAFPLDVKNVGAETVGLTLVDEADMKYRAGADRWTGKDGWNTCVPIQDKGGRCGYTVMSTLLRGHPATEGRLRYANYGKGIFPGWMSEIDFARFVNDFTNVVSDDLYWYTDPSICVDAQGPTIIKGSGPVSRYTSLHDLLPSECRRSANYGAVVDRMRKIDSLDGKFQPVYAFVEAGTPADGGGTITGPQLEGAVMSSLIHGAAGILYFKHNFGGPCVTNDVFVDCPSAPKESTSRINGYIRELAPVLNSQSVDYSFDPDVDSMLKWHGGAAYVFAMAHQGKIGRRTFVLPPGLHVKTVSVMHENRSLPVRGGKFSDSFENEFTYHIYRIVPR